MKAITTKYLPMTATRPARVLATDNDGNSLVVGADSVDAHSMAAKKLKDKMGWKGRMVGGNLRSGSTVWVFADGGMVID